MCSLGFRIVHCNKKNGIMRKKLKTTTVRWWLPLPAAVSGGGVLSCVGIAILGMFGQGTKTLMGLETLMGPMRLNGHKSPNI